MIETAAGHHCHADVFHKKLRELDVVLVAEGADVGHHIVSAIRVETAEAHVLQDREQAVAPHRVVRLQMIVVRARQSQSVHARFL